MDRSSQIETKLGEIFKCHLSAINHAIEPVTLKALWQDIAIRYNEPQRAYHTLKNIQQLFEQFDQIKDNLCQSHIVALTLFYHDVIYEPTRSDNELKSAEYAVESLSPYLSAEQYQHIYVLIMMTASHQIDKLTDEDKISDATYLLDMDLSILGASWSEYEQYAKNVRQEYAHVSNADYCVGRVEVLEELLAHSTLYLTDDYHSRLEQQARDNIKREITLLRAS